MFPIRPLASGSGLSWTRPQYAPPPPRVGVVGVEQSDPKEACLCKEPVGLNPVPRFDKGEYSVLNPVPGLDEGAHSGLNPVPGLGLKPDPSLNEGVCSGLNPVPRLDEGADPRFVEGVHSVLNPDPRLNGGGLNTVPEETELGE